MSMIGKESEMKSTLQKTIIVVFAIAIICAAGCQESQTPSQKQSRVIAARNMELEKQVAERDKQIGDLKAQYTVRVGLEQKKLAACQKQIADCKGQLGKAMDEKVNEVLISSIEEGAKIHAENVKLKAEIA